MQSHTRSKRKRLAKRYLICPPARIGQIMSQVLTFNRFVDFFAVTRGKPFPHENVRKSKLYTIDEVPFASTSVHDTFFWPNVQKKMEKRTCCVHHTANLIGYSCLACNLAPATCNVCQTYKKNLSKIVKYMPTKISYIFTLFWHFWAEILTLSHVWPDLVLFKTPNQKKN
jgi:hypothetical protein